MEKIKGIILDVDGVIVGEKIGYNSPNPNSEVIEKLNIIRSKGIFISLCTAKPVFAIKKIIEDANLDSYHIADGGSLIINPVEHKIVKEHILNKDEVKQVLKMCLNNNIYTEFYTEDAYYTRFNIKC